MLELLVLLLLVLINGVLAGTEMAVVTARRSRLEALAAGGHRGAAAVLRLRRDPERFLASVQVGITLVGAVAGAFGGSAFAARLTPWIVELGIAAPLAPRVAFALVVVLVTYLTVVFGELVPKSLGLRFGDRAAVLVARPMLGFARFARPAVRLLTASSNLVLRGFGDRTDFLEGRVTREDLELMVREVQSDGSVDAPTGKLLSRALEFGELRVGDVMVHRREVVALPRDASEQQLREALVVRGIRRVPVFDGTIDRVVGYLLRDDVLAALWDRRPVDVAALIREPFFVPEQTSAEGALRELQARRAHLAIVVEDTGGVAGIVTLEDLVEELVGEIFHERDAPDSARAVREPSGAWLVKGSVELRELARGSGVVVPPGIHARTVGGLCTELAENRIPRAGESFELPDGTRLEVVEASARRVQTVRVRAAQ